MTIETILPTPDIFETKRLLCVQPHYDDNDIAAAGLLLQLRQRGAQIFYLTVSDDLMGVVDASLSAAAAARALRHDQARAGQIVGVSEQTVLGYPDAGVYSHHELRADILAHIRRLQPDFVLTADPWLTYEAHQDHIRTGLATAEAVMFAGLKKIASSDAAVDAAYPGHAISGIVFYYTREPNLIADIGATWEQKVAALRCYQAQFTPEDMDMLLMGMEMKARQVAGGAGFDLGEPFKVLHPQALHCGL